MMACRGDVPGYTEVSRQAERGSQDAHGEDQISLADHTRDAVGWIDDEIARLEAPYPPL